MNETSRFVTRFGYIPMDCGCLNYRVSDTTFELQRVCQEHREQIERLGRGIGKTVKWNELAPEPECREEEGK